MMEKIFILAAFVNNPEEPENIRTDCLGAYDNFIDAAKDANGIMTGKTTKLFVYEVSIIKRPNYLKLFDNDTIVHAFTKEMK